MFDQTLRMPSAFGRSALLATTAAGTAAMLFLWGAGAASAAVAAVPLGTAESFVVLAGTEVTATGANTLNGDLGVFPGTSISGTGTITVNGTDHGGDLVTQGAKDDLVTAFNAAASQVPPSDIAADLASQHLMAGVYNAAATLNLSGELTLDAEGDPDAQFVFQATSDLIVGPGASVTLINGAQACNVTWVVASSASLDSGATFRGSILALTSITLNAGATVEGRVLARDGLVSLSNNTITAPVCVAGTSETPTGGVQTGDGSAAVAAGGVDSTFVAAGTVSVLVAVGIVFAVLTRRRLRTV
jgi:hypothetical protein